MRILIRTSRWAIWARRLGALSIPLVVIAVLLHREDLIASNVFNVVAALALVVAAGAVVAAVIALARLWWTGDQGWKLALSGLFFALVALLPFAWYGNLVLRYPPVTDIATTDRATLPLVFDATTMAMPTPRMLTAADMARVFPNVETRTYPLGMQQTFALVQRLVEERGWEVRTLIEPSAELSPGRINARIVTPAGWREEAVIRVEGTETDAKVDMRSASRNALHDFGSNGLRIEEFLGALDDAVTGLLRDNPNANLPVEADEPEPAAN